MVVNTSEPERWTRGYPHTPRPRRTSIGPPRRVYARVGTLARSTVGPVADGRWPRWCAASTECASDKEWSAKPPKRGCKSNLATGETTQAITELASTYREIAREVIDTVGGAPGLSNDVRYPGGGRHHLGVPNLDCERGRAIETSMSKSLAQGDDWPRCAGRSQCTPRRKRFTPDSRKPARGDLAPTTRSHPQESARKDNATTTSARAGELDSPIPWPDAVVKEIDRFERCRRAMMDQLDPHGADTIFELPWNARTDTLRPRSCPSVLDAGPPVSRGEGRIIEFLPCAVRAERNLDAVCIVVRTILVLVGPPGVGRPLRRLVARALDASSLAPRSWHPDEARPGTGPYVGEEPGRSVGR